MPEEEKFSSNRPHLPGLKIQYTKYKPVFHFFRRMHCKATVAYPFSEFSEVYCHLIGRGVGFCFKTNVYDPAYSNIEISQMESIPSVLFQGFLC